MQQRGLEGFRTTGDGASGALFMYERNGNMNKILTWKLHRKRPSVTVTPRQEDNIKCNLIFRGMFWNAHNIINRAMTETGRLLNNEL